MKQKKVKEVALDNYRDRASTDIVWESLLLLSIFVPLIASERLAPLCERRNHSRVNLLESYTSRAQSFLMEELRSYSWCRHHNIPSFSNITSSYIPSENCWGPQCTCLQKIRDRDPIADPHKCDGSDPFSLCEGITAVSAYETTVDFVPPPGLSPAWDLLRSEMNKPGSIKCRDFPGYCRPILFVLLGTADGHLTVMLSHQVLLLQQKFRLTSSGCADDTGSTMSRDEQLLALQLNANSLTPAFSWRLPIFDGNPIKLVEAVTVGSVAVYIVSDGVELAVFLTDTYYYLSQYSLQMLTVRQRLTRASQRRYGVPADAVCEDRVDAAIPFHSEAVGWGVAVLVSLMCRSDVSLSMYKLLQVVEIFHLPLPEGETLHAAFQQQWTELPDHEIPDACPLLCQFRGSPQQSGCVSVQQCRLMYSSTVVQGQSYCCGSSNELPVGLYSPALGAVSPVQSFVINDGCADCAEDAGFVATSVDAISLRRLLRPDAVLATQGRAESLHVFVYGNQAGTGRVGTILYSLSMAAAAAAVRAGDTTVIDWLGIRSDQALIVFEKELRAGKVFGDVFHRFYQVRSPGGVPEYLHASGYGQTFCSGTRAAFPNQMLVFAAALSHSDGSGSSLTVVSLPHFAASLDGVTQSGPCGPNEWRPPGADEGCLENPVMSLPISSGFAAGVRTLFSAFQDIGVVTDSASVPQDTGDADCLIEDLPVASLGLTAGTVFGSAQSTDLSVADELVGSMHHVVSAGLHRTDFADSNAVFGVRINPLNLSHLTAHTELLFKLDLMGKYSGGYLSPNALHSLAVVKLPNFMLQTMSRHFNICKTSNPGPAVERLRSQSGFDCDQLTLPQLALDVWYMGSCKSGLYCPSLVGGVSENLTLAPGFYSSRPWEASICEPGYFCVFGNRVQCPPGYMCPVAGLTTPKLCQEGPNMNTTCFHDRTLSTRGLTTPLPCPAGRVCTVPYAPGVGTSPGFYVTNGTRNHLHSCSNGDWCPIGRSNGTLVGECDGACASLLCPPGLYCPSPSIMSPEVCRPRCPSGVAETDVSLCSYPYCPAGSSAWQNCTAGFYCQASEGGAAKGFISRQRCVGRGQFCPAGSYAPVICPAGFYCPKVSQSILCPQGSYCPEGSVAPYRCPFYAYCAPGSSKMENAWGGPVLVLSILLVMGLGWRYYLYRRNQLRLYRESQRKATERSSTDDDGVELLSSYGSVASAWIGQHELCVEFELDNVGLTLKANGKKVVDGVSGKIRSGRVTAVMGPSGAGKTSFLTTLAGKAGYGTVTGTILINGELRPITQLSKLVGFVPQEDIMHRELTVKEVLQNSAALRLPSSVVAHDRSKLVNGVLRTLGLWDIRHSRIGDESERGISGGQRKRVNIGMELVADPRVLFLDEPTSGLDSASTLSVCSALRNVADSGITVVAVIHQPRYEVFMKFHDVLLLGVGGRTVYLGPSEGALPYFSSIGFDVPSLVNPPDYFMDVIAGEVECNINPDDWSKERLFDEWESAARADTGRSSRMMAPLSSLPADHPACRVTAGGFTQTFYFAKRGLSQYSRKWAAAIFDILLICIAALFMGVIYLNKRFKGPMAKELITPQMITSGLCPNSTVMGCLEFVPSMCTLPQSYPLMGESAIACLSLSLGAVAASLRLFGAERIVYWREASTGISTTAYFVGKCLSHMPALMLPPALFTFVYQWMLVPRASGWECFLLFFSIYFTAAGWGYLSSIALPPAQAQICAVLSVLVMMMFSGQTPRQADLYAVPAIGPALNLFTYASYLRWGEEIFVVQEMEQFLTAAGGAYSSEQLAPALQMYCYSFDGTAKALGILWALGIGVRLLALLALHVLHKDKKL